jgi:hypothetical protein
MAQPDQGFRVQLARPFPPLFCFVSPVTRGLAWTGGAVYNQSHTNQETTPRLMALSVTTPMVGLEL